MSGITATDFTEGAELFDQEKYWSQVSISIEPDPRTIDATFARPLSERISPPFNTEGIYSDYRVDDVVVRTVSDAFRRHEVNQWNRVKKEAEDKQWAWSATAVGSFVVAVVIGVFVNGSKNHSGATPFVLIVGFVATAVSGVFALIARAAVTKAVDQINKWSESPVMKIAKERNEAFDLGFPYIYALNLKLGREPSYTGRFHPKQVEHEYKKYFEAFCKKQLSESCSTCKASWMDSFSENNPLSTNLMLYGLGEVPERLVQVTADYERLNILLTEIRSSSNELKNREREVAKERIDGYNRERALKLEPYVSARDTALAAAKDIRDRALDKHPLPTSQQHRDAKRTYDATKMLLDDDYALRAAPINKTYDGKILEVEKDRDARIQRLDDQKSHQLVNNYNAARDLLIRADRAWKGNLYQPVNFQQYFPWQPPVAQPVYYPVQQPYYPPQPSAPAYPHLNPGYQEQPQNNYGMQQQVYQQPPAGYQQPPQNPEYPYGNAQPAGY